MILFTGALKPLANSNTKIAMNRDAPIQYMGILFIEYASSPSKIKKERKVKPSMFENFRFNLSSYILQKTVL